MEQRVQAHVDALLSQPCNDVDSEADAVEVLADVIDSQGEPASRNSSSATNCEVASEAAT